MTATKQTVYGDYFAYVSDETGAANIFADLAGALNNERVTPQRVLLFDVQNKIVVYSTIGK